MALAAFLWLGATTLRAQEHPSSPEAPQAEAQAEHSAKAEGGHGEAGHHGPEIKLFGQTLGKGAKFGVKLFNFALFAGLLYVLLKGALSAAFKLRAQELREKLGEAEREKAEAEAQIRELEARMAGMQAELDGILSRAGADAEAEKQRILEAARHEAEQILAQARQEIEFQQRQAEQELRALVAELAVQGATQRLQSQVQGALATDVLDKAIQQVGGDK